MPGGGKPPASHGRVNAARFAPVKAGSKCLPQPSSDPSQLTGPQPDCVRVKPDHVDTTSCEAKNEDRANDEVKREADTTSYNAAIKRAKVEKQPTSGAAATKVEANPISNTAATYSAEKDNDNKATPTSPEAIGPREEGVVASSKLAFPKSSSTFSPHTPSHQAAGLLPKPLTTSFSEEPNCRNFRLQMRPRLGTSKPLTIRPVPTEPPDRKQPLIAPRKLQLISLHLFPLQLLLLQLEAGHRGRPPVPARQTEL